MILANRRVNCRLRRRRWRAPSSACVPNDLLLLAPSESDEWRDAGTRGDASVGGSDDAAADDANDVDDSFPCVGEGYT